MRQTISGLVAAIAMMTVSAAPAMACGGVFGGSCYVPAPVYSACNSGCGWAHERLPDPERQYGVAAPYAGPQYYYVNQGPTYTGPGNWAPLPTYRESAVSGPVVYSYRAHRHHRAHHYGYAQRHYGHHGHVLRRYY
jgi:hypothetical protein